MKIYWATKLRGFLRHISANMPDVEFVEKAGYYETNTASTKMKSRLIRSPLLDLLGIFQVVKISTQQCDAYASFNRFLDADKPYFIYLENPTALYHYALRRIRYSKGQERFRACLKDPNLRYIVCMSEACKSSFVEINMPLPEHVKIKTIYPFVPANGKSSPERITEKSCREYLECLFCVQGIRFVSKGGLEVLSAYRNLRQKGVKIHLTVITKLSDLDKKVLSRLESYEDVTLRDFSFSYDELEEIYADTNVLLQPSSDDSFGLTVLEAMKGGCAVLCSRLYAFPEMVEDGVNGFLVEPKYWFFDSKHIPNPKIWNHRKRTIHSHRESRLLVKQLEERLIQLEENRKMLASLSLNSLLRANTKFGETQISEEWEDVLCSLK